MADISISTVDDLINLAAGSNHGTADDPLNVTLESDLDFAEVENWRGLTGTWYMYFNGGNHTISNIHYTGTEQWAFINTLYGTVKNLTLKDINIVTTNQVRGVVYTHNSSNAFPAEISNVKVEGYLSGSYATGISGGGLNILKCSFSGSLIGSMGARGIVDGSPTVSECYVSCVGENMIASRGNYGIMLIGGNNVLNSFFIGNVNRFTGNSSINLCSYNPKYGYAVITNAAELAAAGYTNPQFPPQGYEHFYYDNSAYAEVGMTFGRADMAATTEQLQSTEWWRSKGLSI